MNPTSNYFNLFIIGLGLILGLSACEEGAVYKQYVEWDTPVWQLDSVASFPFTINDATTTYDLSYMIRNSSEYPYYNLYTYGYILHEGDTLTAGMDDQNLLDPKTGKPLGAGIGDFFNHTFLWKEQYTFPDTGQYEFKIQQYMRVNSLDAIEAVGFKVTEAATAQ